MDSVPKFLASIVVIILGVLLCVSFVISSVTVNSARTYHSAVIEEIEASHYDELTIQKCLETAEKDHYSLFIEKMSTSESEPQYFYKVTLKYGLTAPIFGKIHTGTLVGYALSGTHWVEPAVKIPENPETGDVFVYGDYEYRYNMYYHYAGTWRVNEDYDGWSARVLDHTKTSYTKPLTNIGETQVVSLRSTYADCANLLIAPEIPESIRDMQYTYQRCTSLSDDVTIPSSVTTLGSAFYGCTSETFTIAPSIPEGVVDMTHAFTDCINLTTPANVPSTVTNLSATYMDCTSLLSAPDLSTASNLKRISSMLQGCTSLSSDMSDYVIPTTVTSGYSLFENCTQLVTAPIIPKNMTYIIGIFRGCTSLTGPVTIHCNPGHNESTGYYEYTEAFAGTVEPITIVGDCTETTKERLAGTATNGNVTY